MRRRRTFIIPLPRIAGRSRTDDDSRQPTETRLALAGEEESLTLSSALSVLTSGGSGFDHLIAIDDEIFSQDRNLNRSPNRLQEIEMSLEEVLVGQHAQTRRAMSFISLSDRDRIKVGSNDPGRWRCLFHFGESGRMVLSAATGRQEQPVELRCRTSFSLRVPSHFYKMRRSDEFALTELSDPHMFPTPSLNRTSNTVTARPIRNQFPHRKQQ